jgi:hypothetical protein
MSVSGYSLSWLRTEYIELQKDRDAFAAALSALRTRILESSESDSPRHPMLHEWAGTRACEGSLLLSLHAIERTLLEVSALIDSINRGESPNIDIPAPPGLADKGKN